MPHLHVSNGGLGGALTNTDGQLKANNLATGRSEGWTDQPDLSLPAVGYARTQTRTFDTDKRRGYGPGCVENDSPLRGGKDVAGRRYPALPRRSENP